MIQPEVIGRRLEKLRGVKAILLYGSVARGEADELSDVDLMVIVDNPLIVESVREELREFNPIITTEEGIRKSVELQPSTIVMLKEAILLYGALPKLPRPRREDFLKELDEALKILDVNESLLSDVDENTTSTVIYSAILRARQAYIIRCLIRNKKMTKKGFIEELKKMGLKPEYYDYYRLARDDKLNIVLPRWELRRIVRAVRRYVKKVRREVKRS
ncbi:nucleotidyltransferase domain-containing protein [Archaeoglobus sp. JdFR-39]|jgi:predicted nucleotidyltransferase|uniref:nucleotidyltransferase domain-containing protein n=1 Tax=Archaeoglobus sp. JdFR-39 TaxID=1934996 RepID=UPI0025C35AE7|nr:nucleotidyltransferase domain-containing protein [Archaeoglobus sp. JdFR-39]